MMLTLMSYSALSDEEPGGARKSQAEPEGTGRSQEEPERTRRSQEEPGGARRNQEEPGGPQGVLALGSIRFQDGLDKIRHEAGLPHATAADTHALLRQRIPEWTMTDVHRLTYGLS